ncbi:hypothetical protein BD410DRAFT_839202 [Rickenella mellea]|uniref:Cytochrome b2 n=1 Tax=Rickenella mellea TaxID=50990 RepID=A0A4Y7Q7P2_9AGAM|nr:hypothetical protein BD410DRAFT_839202 [Rickenella mellea]
MPLSLRQVAEHNSKKSCWVIIKNKVYDVTEFLPEHPGGSKIILKYAGKDATSAYEPIHPPDALDKNLPPEKHLGDLDAEGVSATRSAQENKKPTLDELRIEKAHKEKPPLSRILTLRDIEEVAQKTLSYKALAYYASAGDDEITNAENARAFTRLFFNARVMRPVSRCDPSTTILGIKSRIPVFASGAALAKLGHPLGEANITRGAGKMSIIQMVSSNASLSVEEIAAARVSPDQALFFQLYKHSDDAAAERIREVERLGYRAIFLTVDALVAGNRERDIRAPFELAEQERVAAGEGEGKSETDMPMSQDEDGEEADGLGTAGALLKGIDMDMTWEKTIPWLRSITKLPIVIKGIQCVEDAVLAAEAGVDGILISNHGVYVDGGVHRGTDVIKALCLGAKAVGLGRPFLYAQSAYGEAGVVRLIKILEREIVSAMRLLGATSVDELVPEMVEQVHWQPLVAKL